MPAKRSDRVGALLQAAIAELLLRDIKDPRIGMVTVTGVDLSVDLRHARVFVSALGDAATRERSLRGLASARPYLQSQVGKRLGLRFTPELRFALDPSFETGERIERLLRELHPADAVAMPAEPRATAAAAPAEPPSPATAPAVERATASAAARRERPRGGELRAPARSGRRPSRRRDGADRDRDG